LRLRQENVSAILQGVLDQGLPENTSLVSAGIDSISAIKIQHLVQSKLGTVLLFISLVIVNSCELMIRLQNSNIRIIEFRNEFQ
jgi:hypothetical protein